MSIRSVISNLFRFGSDYRASSEAYDLWSASYDDQPGNLMLDLDEEVFNELAKEIGWEGARVLDVGCGTGRHWPAILQRLPGSLKGFDSSPGMLLKLKEKFPGASAILTADHHLTGVDSESIDCIVCTLTIAHIQDPAPYFLEWHRVLREGAAVILTDYHPEALSKGARRTFRHEGKSIAIKNYVHDLKTIRNLAEQLGFRETRFIEKIIDSRVEHYYRQQKAMHLYESFFSSPILYGMILKKI